MDRDIRDSERYRSTEEFFKKWMEPGFGKVTAAVEPALRPDGRAVAMTGTLVDKLEGLGSTRIAIADEQGMRMVTSGPHDRCPRWSPDGKALAFLSDRASEGVFGLYLLREELGEAIATPPVEGTIEYCSWSPDGAYVLLGVAGQGADLAGGQGSGTTKSISGDGPDWLPETTGNVSDQAWRSSWVYDVQRNDVRRVSADGLNIWEATWLGNDQIAAVASYGDPGEGAWYTASLVEVGAVREAIPSATSDAQRTATPSASSVLYKPGAQLGWPAASPEGHLLAVVEAVCSDRWIVAGELRLIDSASGEVRTIETAGVDVSALQWIDGDRLGYMGVRGLETVVGWYDVDTDTRTELLVTKATSGRRYPEAAFAADGSAALILEAYDQVPTVVRVTAEGTSELATFSHLGTDWLRSVSGQAAPFSWSAPDGQEMQGILCRPAKDGPFPLVVLVHGGPVWSFRDRWRMGYDYTTLLVSRGYAVLHPNPRGSSGRGQEFASAVVGDMGGADASDILAGIDALVDQGLADPAKVGVTGGSYGGFMSCWLVTQDRRFAAAVPIAPTSNWYSQHYSSNIGHFDALFLDADPYAAGGKHHQRSPVVHAGSVRTPTLLIAGARDRCTPPGQALEFHNALREHGVDTELVIYPQEGHGVRSLPARIDVAARILAWFERYMPAEAGSGAGDGA